MERRPPDPKSTPTVAERRRLLDVNRAAAMFYRRQLLQAKNNWATNYLAAAGAREVLDPSSKWAIGYAPDARSRLVDSLRSRGFDQSSVRNAGLALLNPEGRTIDRFRDHLVLPARNDRLETVGFVGVRTTPEAYYVTSPETQVHRRSAAILGVAEQLDLLSEGATPVLVNDVLDAFAVERISRLTVGRWAGIPLCDRLLSVEQARILARYAASDTVIIAVRDTQTAQRAAIGFLDDLSRFFVRVWAAELPTRSSVDASANGQQALHDALLTTRPLADYRGPHRRRRYAELDPGLAGPVPEL